MVDVVVFAAGGLVASCLAVSAYVESAGGRAWRKRWCRAHPVKPADILKPWTKRSNAMVDVPPANLRPDEGNSAWCLLCGVRCEKPTLYCVMKPGRMYAEVILCTGCWPKAAKEGVVIELGKEAMAEAYRHIKSKNA